MQRRPEFMPGREVTRTVEVVAVRCKLGTDCDCMIVAYLGTVKFGAACKEPQHILWQALALHSRARQLPIAGSKSSLDKI